MPSVQAPTCCRPFRCPWVASSSRSAALCHLSFCRTLLGSWEGFSTAMSPFSSIHSISSATSRFHSCPRTRREWVPEARGEGWCEDVYERV